MKLKPFEWLFIIYQLIIIIIVVSYKQNIFKVDYRLLIGGHICIIFFIMLVISRIQIVWLRNLYPFLVLPFLYKEIGLLNHILFLEPKDELFISIDKVIFFGENVGLTFCKHFSSKLFSEIMHFFYFSYYLVLFLPAIYFLKKYPSEFDRYMFVMFLSFFLYYIIFIFYPVYGPEFYISNYLGYELKPLKGFYFKKILTIILDNGEINGAAFPSSHVGISLIIFLLLKDKSKFVSILVFICFLGICVATVYCRAHYGIDVLAGILTAFIFYKFSVFIYDNLI